MPALEDDLIDAEMPVCAGSTNASVSYSRQFQKHNYRMDEKIRVCFLFHAIFAQ